MRHCGGSMDRPMSQTMTSGKLGCALLLGFSFLGGCASIPDSAKRCTNALDFPWFDVAPVIVRTQAPDTPPNQMPAAQLSTTLQPGTDRLAATQAAADGPLGFAGRSGILPRERQ